MLANYGFKLRYIFLPAALLIISFPGVYTLFYWLLVTHWQLADPTFQSNFWLLAALGGITSFLGLRNRINLFRRGSDDRWIALFYLAPCATMVFVSLYACEYLTQATGTLTELRTPTEAAHMPAKRFYTLRQGYAYKLGSGVEIITTPTGRNNTRLLLEVYVACPMLTSPADTAGKAALWLGWKNSREISASLAPNEKERLFKQFLAACDSAYQEANLTSYRYLSRITAADGKNELLMAAQRSRFYEATNTLIFLHPQLEPFEQRTIPSLQRLAWSLGLGFGVYLLMLVFPEVATTAGEMWLSGGTYSPLWPQIRPIILPRPGYVATPLLVGSILLIYLLMAGTGMGVVSFRAGDLLRWGAVSGLAVRQGEWWRMLTGSFLHGGLMHIIYNATALGLICWMVEAVAGTTRVLLIYAISALGASLLSIWWHPDAVGVGASGAIFGLYGAAIVLSQSQRVPEEDRAGLLLVPVFFGGLSLLFGWFMPSVDNAAHIGGLLAGAVISLLLLPTFPSYYQQARRRR